jgi:hypothetical protein
MYVGVAASVLSWLALNIVWCIRSGNGERLFRRRGFFLKRCSGRGGRRLLPLSVEDEGRERDDRADENERNGRCEQATGPNHDRSHLRSASLSNTFGSFETTLAPGRNKAPDRYFFAVVYDSLWLLTVRWAVWPLSQSFGPLSSSQKVFLHFSATSTALFDKIRLLDCAGPIDISRRASSLQLHLPHHWEGLRSLRSSRCSRARVDSNYEVL